VTHWDDETDVLVVGYGCAGASAAWEAATAGADVLVLERASGPGGSSALSGGEVYLGGGTALQRENGVDDDPSSMRAFMRTALGPGVDEAKVDAYVDASVEHYDWLAGLGVPFQKGVYEELSWMPPTDDGLMWLGERTWPFTEVQQHVAPRGHRPATGHFGGWLLMEKLADAVKQSGARELFDVYAERLVVEEGRVVGVVAKQYGEEKAFRARKAVVITTGGFVDDEEMLALHAPELVGFDKVSGGNDDGSGIRMAQALGADTLHMNAGQVGFHCVPALMARGIVVNRLGQRFINEDTYPGRVGQAALYQQRMGCWVITDEAGFEDVPAADRWGMLPQHTADTLAELEELTGLPSGSLEATVALYNHHADKGEDPLCHKDSRYLKPIRPPYAAFDPRRSFRGPNDPTSGPGAAVFTLGGLRTDVDGHVLDMDGSAIPGLLAAGRATSGLAAWGYISGTSLGDGTYFGRLAGRTAARDLSR
jgi:3-oxo-5alpha-steroid 4-dehydrogenase